MLPKGRRPKQFGRIRPTLWQDTVLSELRDDVIGELVRSQLPNLLFGEFMLWLKIAILGQNYDGHDSRF